MQSKESQSKTILNHLKTKGALTSLEALNLYGCMRLAARIFELKEQGHQINGVNIQVKNRFDEYVTVKRYFI